MHFKGVLRTDCIYFSAFFILMQIAVLKNLQLIFFRSSISFQHQRCCKSHSYKNCFDMCLFCWLGTWCRTIFLSFPSMWLNRFIYRMSLKTNKEWWKVQNLSKSIGVRSNLILHFKYKRCNCLIINSDNLVSYHHSFAFVS